MTDYIYMSPAQLKREKAELEAKIKKLGKSITNSLKRHNLNKKLTEVMEIMEARRIE